MIQRRKPVVKGWFVFPFHALATYSASVVLGFAKGVFQRVRPTYAVAAALAALCADLVIWMKRYPDGHISILACYP